MTPLADSAAMFPQPSYAEAPFRGGAQSRRPVGAERCGGTLGVPRGCSDLYAVRNARPRSQQKAETDR